MSVYLSIKKWRPLCHFSDAYFFNANYFDVHVSTPCVARLNLWLKHTHTLTKSERYKNRFFSSYNKIKYSFNIRTYLAQLVQSPLMGQQKNCRTIKLILDYKNKKTKDKLRTFEIFMRAKLLVRSACHRIFLTHILLCSFCLHFFPPSFYYIPSGFFLRYFQPLRLNPSRFFFTLFYFFLFVCPQFFFSSLQFLMQEIFSNAHT